MKQFVQTKNQDSKYSTELWQYKIQLLSFDDVNMGFIDF